MTVEKNLSFEIHNSKSKETSNFFKKFILPHLILLFLVFIPLLFFALDFSFINEPIFYFAVSIVLLQILIFKILKFYSKKIYRIQFANNFITINYKSGNSDRTTNLLLDATSIQLFEIKDHRSFFQGLQINFLNKRLREKYKLLDSEWNYIQMEEIYNEFKRRKNERIPENEKNAYAQLQVMNGTQKNVS
ncbi:MAG: hypothetical protein KUL76_02820 [Kaistella sp.]|nr:hypothetical protein [Kaistella sp.]